MYNTQYAPPYQHYDVIVCCCQEVVWKMALVAGLGQHCVGNERMTTCSDVT